MVEEGQPDSLGFLVGSVIGGILCGLGFWHCGGGEFFDADGVGQCIMRNSVFRGGRVETVGCV
jgi:hypothetical protein